VPRSPDEIIRAYEAQGRFLAASCQAYDAGEKYEALRLATSVYTLVHDAGKQHSLLSQLGVKQEIIWISTARPPDLPGDRGIFRSLRYTPLIQYERYRDRKRYANKIPEFLPLSTFLAIRGERPVPRQLPFEEWWESDIIFLDEEEHAVLSRKKLVMALRNQEGGSHYDPEVINPNYLPLRKKIWMLTPNYGFGWSLGLELATMRQIAEELLMSLQTWSWRRAMRQQLAP
jgi:hypothetical protein